MATPLCFWKIAGALLGAIEALNGVLLFGLTTAFLFAIIQHVWLQGHQPPPRNS